MIIIAFIINFFIRYYIYHRVVFNLYNLYNIYHVADYLYTHIL